MRIRNIIIAGAGAMFLSGCAYDNFGYGDNGYGGDSYYGYYGHYGYASHPRRCWDDYYGTWYNC